MEEKEEEEETVAKLGGVSFEESLFGRRRETEDLGEEDYKNEIDLV